jgi:hypothetical protein
VAFTSAADSWTNREIGTALFIALRRQACT